MALPRVLFVLVFFTSAVWPLPANAFFVPSNKVRTPSVAVTRNAAAGDTDFDDYYPGAEREVAFKDITIGTGKPAGMGDEVWIKYKGTLLKDGFQFDAGAITFKLGAGRVIPGWEEGLMGVRTGGKRILKIPPNLAYGRSGAGGTIPPNADLEFECQVKSVASGPMGKIKMSFKKTLNLKSAAIVCLLGYIFLGGKK